LDIGQLIDSVTHAGGLRLRLAQRNPLRRAVAPYPQEEHLRFCL